MTHVKTQSTQPLIPDPANDQVPASLPLNPHLVALMEEHGDLDGAIAALLASGSRDDLQVTRLKKRKLQIKDEIAQVIPTH